MPSHYGLKSFIHRRLALRLFIGGLLIAVIFGTMTYVARFDDIGQAAVVHATNGIERVMVRVRRLLQSPNYTFASALQRALDEKPEYRIVSRYGRYVYARFYTPDGEVIAKSAFDPDSVPLPFQALMREAPRHFPEFNAHFFTSHQYDRRTYIQVVLPLSDDNGAIRAYGEGLYALSDEAIVAARDTVFRTVGYVVLIVAATSLLLYPVILGLANRLASFSGRLLESNLETIQVLGNAIAKRDSDTDAHNYRVTLYAVRLAESAELGTETIRGLIKGALLHDVGKIGIRDHILHKPARLDEAEFRIMRTHVDQGLEIIERSGWLDDAAEIVGSHHEKYDGSGYPRQLKGEEIPLGARIFAIVDVFDALTSRRPYKDPLGYEETMMILEEGRGSHFDPALLDLFTKSAAAMHQRYGGREDEGLHQELDQVVQKYFAEHLESLVH